MAIDLDALSAPVSEEQPSGPDLSYENERQEIESAFEQSVSTDGGEDETDWRSTIKLILGEAAKTRDLWLPVYLMRAAAKSANFEMLVDGAELLARLVEQRWEDVHPQLDEYGFIGRKTPCESLTTLRDFLNPLAQIPLIEHSRLGRFSGSDFDRFKEQGTSAEGYGMFRALIDSEGVEPLREAATRLDAIKDAIKRVDTVMTANAEGDTSTNFQATYELLDKIRRGVAAQLPADEQPVDDSAAEDSASPGGGGSAPASGGSGGPGFSGGINSRDDVARALDAISLYYSRHEPNSPVPYALRRAKEWISLDFLAVLEDIAPGGLGEAKKILTSGRNTGGSSSGGSDDWSSSSPASASSSSSSDDGWS
jgi:type VI secretion system protein ImpA